MVPAPDHALINPLDWIERHRLFRVPLILLAADHPTITAAIIDGAQRGGQIAQWSRTLRSAMADLPHDLHQRAERARTKQRTLAEAILTADGPAADRLAALRVLGIHADLPGISEVNTQEIIASPLTLMHAWPSLHPGQGLVPVLADRPLDDLQLVVLGLHGDPEIQDFLENKDGYGARLACHMSANIHRRSQTGKPCRPLTSVMWQQATGTLADHQTAWQVRQALCLAWLSAAAALPAHRRELLLDDLGARIQSDRDAYGIRLKHWLEQHLRPQPVRAQEIF